MTSGATTAAWENAKERFLENLDSDEKKKFKNATPESIFYDADQTHQNFTGNSKLQMLQNRLEPLTNALEQYGRALDILSNTSPLFLSPIWGSIRIILQLSRASKDYHEKVTLMFARVGEALPRLRSCESLFPNDLALRNSISDAYVTVIEFCTDIKGLFKSQRKFRAAKLIGKSLYKPLDRCLEDALKKMRYRDQSVQANANLARWTEQKAIKELSLEEEQKRSFLAVLDRFDYTHKHTFLCNVRQQSTCQWLLEDPRYMAWNGASTSAGLVLWGIPGSGKSVLSSFLIECFLTCSEADSAICYHHCDYSDHRTLSPANAYASMARQLLEKDRIPQDVKSLIKPWQNVVGEVDEMMSRDVFTVACAQNSSTIIIVDGVDELSKISQSSMIAFLKGIMNSHRHIKVIIFSRREEMTIRQGLGNFHQIEITRTLLKEDIELFTRTTVSARIDMGLLHIVDEELEMDVISTLVAEAKDM